jgi:hypothetical protein
MIIHALQYSANHSVDSESQGFMPTMLAVHTSRPDDSFGAAAYVGESLVCTSVLTGARFQIRLMQRLNRDQQIRFAYFSQVLKMGCGWQTTIFAEHPTTPPCSFLIDHQRRMLFVDGRVLSQSHENVLNLSSHIAEYLKSVSGGQNPGCEDFFASDSATRLFIGQTASVDLMLDPKNGLRFPSFVALSSDELTVHVSTAGDEIYIRSAVWRLFHKTFEPLPCYSYQINVVSDADSYIIPLPMQLVYMLSRVPKLTFHVYAI